MTEFKELEKLETCAQKISKIIQKEYEVEPFIADELSLHFLSNNFKAPLSLRTRYSISKKWKALKLRVKNSAVAYIVLIVILAMCGVSGGRYLYNTYSDKLPYTAVVAEDYKLCGKYIGCKEHIGNSHIWVPEGSELSFDYQFENLQEGQSVDMTGSDGHTITMTKKNHQVVLVEHE